MMKKLFWFCALTLLSSFAFADMTTCHGRWSVYVDGKLELPQHNKETEAIAHFFESQLNNPESVVIFVGGESGQPITCGASSELHTLIQTLISSSPFPDEPDDSEPPVEDPPTIPPTTTRWRGIPDPSQTLGFDVFADYAISQTLSGAQGKKTLSCSGTAQAPCLIDASAATFSSLTLSGSHIVLQGGKVNAPADSGPFVRSCSYCVIRDLEVAGPGTNQRHSSAVGMADNSVWIGGSVHDFGDYRVEASENDFHGFKVMSDNVWILNVESYKLGGDTVQVGDASRGDANNVYIGGGYFHDNKENGVDIKDSRNVVVSGVRMANFLSSASSSGEAIVIHDDAYDAQVLDNVIDNANIGIYFSSAGGFKIYDNNITNSKTGITCGSVRDVDMQGNNVSANKPFHYWGNCGDLDIVN